MHCHQPLTLQAPWGRYSARVCSVRQVQNNTRPITACLAQAPHDDLRTSDPGSSQIRRWLASVVTAAATFALAALPAVAEDVTITFPASANPEIRKAQQTLVEAWAYVSGLYVDPAYNGKNWKGLAQDALAASFKASGPEEVYQQMDKLLEQLEDPFTRVLRAEDAAAFAAQEEGKVVATGLGLVESGGAELVVDYVVEKSPAAAAGVQVGDKLVQVNGESVSGKSLKDVYKLLRKEAEVEFVRSTTTTTTTTTTSSSGDAAGSSSGEMVTAVLKPEALEFDPVQYALLDLQAAPPEDATTAAATSNSAPISQVASSSSSSSTEEDIGTASSSAAAAGGGSRVNSGPPIYLKAASVGASAASSQPSGTTSTTTASSSSSNDACTHPGQCIGYLRIVGFSTSAPQLVAEGLAALEPAGLQGWVLDLRANPGGLVAAGVDVAEDFLPEGQVLLYAADKYGQEEEVRLPEAHPMTSAPMVVLVNNQSSSTSELLAGALHDNYHALLLGEPTYGKGRTQQVLPLSDGSTLLVSTTEYFTPSHTKVDKVGLQPDVVCAPEVVVGEQWQAGAVTGGSLLEDPCIKKAAEELVAGRVRAPEF